MGEVKRVFQVMQSMESQREMGHILEVMSLSREETLSIPTFLRALNRDSGYHCGNTICFNFVFQNFPVFKNFRKGWNSMGGGPRVCS